MITAPVQATVAVYTISQGGFDPRRRNKILETMIAIRKGYWMVGEDGIGAFIWMLYIFGKPVLRKWNYKRVL